MLKIGTYQHFKGKFYEVLHVAKHSETEELMVVYPQRISLKRFGLGHSLCLMKQ
jgi:hypothetical protein